MNEWNLPRYINAQAIHRLHKFRPIALPPELKKIFAIEFTHTQHSCTKCGMTRFFGSHEPTLLYGCPPVPILYRWKLRRQRKSIPLWEESEDPPWLKKKRSA